MPIGASHLGHSFNLGLENVHEAGPVQPTIDLKPKGLLRQDAALRSRIDELFAAGLIDDRLYGSVKPSVVNTTRTGTVSFADELASVRASIPELIAALGIPPGEAEDFARVLQEDIGNQELLGACRRALLNG
jgi:hypothetical protein